MKYFNFSIMSVIVLLMLINFNQAGAQGASYSNDNLPSYGQYLGTGEITYPPTTARMRVHAIHYGLTQAAPPDPGMSSTYSTAVSYMLSVSTDDGTTWTTYDVPGALSFSAQYSSATTDERTFSTEMLSMEVGGSSLGGVMLRESPTLQSTGTTKIKRVTDASFRIGSFFDIFTEVSLDGGATWTRSATASRIKLHNESPSHIFASDNFPPEGQFSSAAGSPPVSFSQTTQLGNLLVATNPSVVSLPSLGSASTQTLSLNFTKISFSFDGGVTTNDYSATCDMQVHLSHVADVGDTRVFDTEMLSMSLSGGTLPGGVMVRESPSKASLGRTSVRTMPSGFMMSSFFDVFTEVSLDGGATWTSASEAVCLDFSSSPPSVSVASNNFPPDGMDFTPSSYGTTTFENGVMIRNMELRRFGIGQTMPESPLGVRSSVSSFFDVFTEVSLDGLVWSPRSNVSPVSFFVTKHHSDGTDGFFDTEMLALDLQPFGGGILIRESPTKASTGRTTVRLQADGTFHVDSFFDIFTEVSLDGGTTWSPSTAPTHFELATATPSPRPVITSISPSSGPVGTIVTIEGTGFSNIPTENLVTLGDKTLPIKWSAPEVLRIVIPEGASTNGLSVTVNGLSSLPPDSVFTVLPNVVSYLPNIGDLQALDVQTGDIDGDGLDETMILGKKDFKGHVTLLKRGGDGSQRVSSVISIPDLDLDTAFTGLLSADCNHDGVVDYLGVVGRQTQQSSFGEKVMMVLENDATHRGKIYRRVLLQQGRVLSSAALHDLTGDDSLDIVCAYGAGGGMPASLEVVKNILGGGASTASYAATGRTIPLGSGDCDDLDFYDMDSDGDLDIVAATGSGIYIFQNNSTDFEFVRTQIVDETHPYSGVAVGDLDGDGHADVVALRSDSGIVNVCFGDPLAPGSVKAPRDAASGMATGRRQHQPIRLADVNGDGTPDIVCASGEPNQTVSLLLVGGALPGGAIISARMNMDDCDDDGRDKLFAVGKFDVDNDCDFAFASCRSTTLSPPFVSSSSPDNCPVGSIVTIEGDNLQDVSSVQIGDFDATFIRESPTLLHVTVPLAERTFAAPHILERMTITCPSGVCAVLKQITVSPVIVSAPPQVDQLDVRFVSSGDVDGDGKDEIVMLGTKGCCRGHVIIMKAYDDGTPTYGKAVASKPTVTSFFYSEDEDCDGLSVGDLNGDGRLDVCVALSSVSKVTTNFVLLFGDSTRPGMFRESPTKIQKQWLPANFRLRSLASEMKDIDGDGKADIVFAIQGTTEDTLVVITNPLSETGFFLSKKGYDHYMAKSDLVLVPRSKCPSPCLPFFDIFLLSSSSLDVYSYGSGGGAGGSLSLVSSVALRESPTRRSLACRDMNGDGLTDAVILDDDSSLVTVCLDRGDGSFKIVSPRDPQSGLPTGKRMHLVVEDLDGDGHPDIAIDEPGVHFAPAKSVRTISDFTYQKIEWTVFYNRTNPPDTTVSFERKMLSMLDYAVSVNNVAVCDLDGDGFQDIVVTGASSSVARPPFIESVSTTRPVVGGALFCLGRNFQSTTSVDVCAPCGPVSSFSALSDSELTVVLPPEFGDKFLTISNADGSAGLASPVTILAAPDMFVSLPPDSLTLPDSRGGFLKPVKRDKKMLFPNWTNLLEEVVVQGGFQPGATESDAAGGLRVGISHIYEATPGKWKPNKDSAKVRAWVVVRGWDPKKNQGKNWGTIQKTLRNKTFLHTGLGRGLDSTGTPGSLKRKFMKGELKGLDPKKTPNQLFAELVALKFNIAASQLGKTPVGFGDLELSDDSSMFDGKSIIEISEIADSAMTYYSRENTVFISVGNHGVNPLYEDLTRTISKINRAFVGSLDTASFWNGKSLTVNGVVDLATVPFLKFPDGAVALTQLRPTTTETSSDYESASDELDQIDVADMPVAAKIFQNYPNPFNPTTTISFAIRNNSSVTLKVFNMLGQEVASFFNNEELNAGSYETEFTADKLASGIYFYRLTVEEKNADGTKAGLFTEIHKMSLLK
ncbi:MAG: VCBS repeat-containing protein [Ignavibacteriales bacterium]|nr:VCBS repeat-containing protein [Ignavibacteriales bacterium]